LKALEYDEKIFLIKSEILKIITIIVSGQKMSGNSRPNVSNFKTKCVSASILRQKPF